MHKAVAWPPNSPRPGSGRHLLWRLASIGHGRAFGLKKSDMAAIDYATYSVNDVITHSLKLHPQLLADCVRSHAGVHAEFAAAYGDPEVTRNELSLADRLASFADAIDLGDYTIPDDPDVRREAFSYAAWLQDLHPIMQKEVAEREGARNVPPGRSG